MERLARDGYVSRRQGRGTFVQASRVEHKMNRLYRLRDELASQGLKQDIRILDWRAIQADGLIAENLRLPDLTTVYRLTRLFLVDGKPLTVETSYFPTSLFSQPLDPALLSENGLYATLTQFGFPPTRATEKLRIILADKETAACCIARRATPACMSPDPRNPMDRWWNTRPILFPAISLPTRST